MGRRLLTGLVLMVISIAAPAATNSPWSVRVWQSEDGLPNNTVTSLAQTADGFLWITSSGQFARFDGTKFELFTPGGLVPGSRQNPRALLQTRDGSLWLGTTHGPVIRTKAGEAQVFTNNLPDMIAQE